MNPLSAMLFALALCLSGCVGVSGGKFYGGLPGVAHIDRGGHFQTDYAVP
jgi:hypothetical protein